MESMELALAAPTALQSIEEKLAYASIVLKSGLIPSSYKTAEAVLVAIETGKELGLPPMRALAMLNVVNGRAGLSAEACVALVLASGHAQYFHEVAVTDEQATYVTHRRGAPGPVEKTFTMREAIAAGLPAKNPTYKTWGKRMLAARCKGFLAHDVYPDVLGGLLTAEEAADLGPDGTPAVTLPERRSETVTAEETPPTDAELDQLAAVQDVTVATEAPTPAANGNVITWEQVAFVLARAKKRGIAVERLDAHLLKHGVRELAALPAASVNRLLAWMDEQPKGTT